MLPRLSFRRACRSTAVICRATLIVLACSFVATLTPVQTQAQVSADAPVLISHADSTRAVALESVTHRAEPFDLTQPQTHNLHPSDRRTRVVLFAYNVGTHATAQHTIEAEDAAR